MPGTLYLVATPIGNLGDITLRAIETLKAATVIAAEDTRETRKLLNHLGIEAQTVSYHDHNQDSMGPKLVERLLSGDDVALVSDAGMPGISDPGEALVRLAAQAGVSVIPVPGATAFVAALVASGLPTGRFVFEGFLPREPKGRRRRLRVIAHESRTLIFYEAPHRLTDTLTDMVATWGADREAVVARELTKLHEEHRRGTLGGLLAHFEATPPRGEIVLMVAGGPEGPVLETGDWKAELAEALAAGEKATAAAKAIAKRYGIARQEVYEAALAMKPAGD